MPRIPPPILKEALLILSSILIALLSSLSRTSDKWMGLWIILPLLWNESDSRRTAFLVALFFYLAVSRGIVPGAYIFFQDGSFIRAFLLWVTSAVILSLPFGIFWAGKGTSALRRFVDIFMGGAVSILPPLGLLCWAHPVAAAGFFFPGLGWRGLVLLLVLYGSGSIDRRVNRAIIAFFLAFLLFGDFPAKREISEPKVLEIDTSFGRLASGSGNFGEQFERERRVFRHIRQLDRNGAISSADVVVLPETLIGRMNSTTKKRWERFFSQWTSKGTVFFVGAEIPAERGQKYDNVMLAFDGSGTLQKAKQRIPVPYSMYRPFGGSGANAYLTSFGTNSILEAKGKKFGVLICYEQFLVWPFLTILSRHPDAIVASANMWWSRDTSLPCIRRRTIRAWAALFDLPLITAVND
jgi:apolipoprotein N-acyltransferase